MSDIPAVERVIDKPKAMMQFHDLYSLLTQECLVYLVPPQPDYQDQVYVTNAGAVLPHLEKTFILSNFRAEGRRGEEMETQILLEKLGFTCRQPPYPFEGEAELKWLSDDIYIGGYGTRTDLRALRWIEDNFDAEIIPVQLTDPYLYHLDCSILPLTSDLIIAYTDGIHPDTLKTLSRFAEIIPITKSQAYRGAANSLRVDYTLYNATCISELPKSDPECKVELDKNQFIEATAREYGLEPVFVNLSEMMKSGALLSCCILHLSYDRVNLCKP